jgi:hypothetical protein
MADFNEEILFAKGDKIEVQYLQLKKTELATSNFSQSLYR